MKKLNGTRLARRSAIALGAVAVAATALSVPTQAAPTWTETEPVNPFGTLPFDLQVAVDDSGDAVAVWRQSDGTHNRIKASSRQVGGAWTTPEYLSLAGYNASTPDVAVNAKGDAVAAWRRYDGSAYRLDVSRRLSNLDWDGFDTVSAFNVQAKAPDVEVAGDGTAYVAYGLDTAGTDSTKLTKLPLAGEATTLTVAYDLPAELALDVNESGSVLTAWRKATGDAQTVKVQTRIAGITKTETIAEGVIGVGLDAALSSDNRALVSYPKQANGDYIIQTFKRSTSGLWGGPFWASDPGEDAFYSSIAMDDNANAVVAWRTTGDKVKAASRYGNSSWLEPVTMVSSAGVSKPLVAMNRRGDVAIQYGDAAPATRLAFRAAGVPTFHQATALANQYVVESEHAVGIDNQGNVVAIHKSQFDADSGRILARMYDVAGPLGAMSTPAKLRTNSTTIPVAWSMTDRFSDVAANFLLVKSAPWNGGFGPITQQLPWTDATSTNVAGAAGRTYCFAARGMDTVGNLGALAAWKCTTTPLDDRKATAAGGFAKKTGTAHFNGTFRQATAKGATLTLKGVKADTIGLLVAKGKNNGKITVFFAGKKLGTWSLASLTNKVKQQILVKNFTSEKTGTLVVKVVSAGKPVRIDGFHIVK
jgi:hypothetical protein